MRVLFLFSGLLYLILLGGCGDSTQPTVYNVEKEPRVVTTGQPMSAQTLPESSINRADQPHWTIPGHWKETPGSAMRIGSFTIDAPEGAIDISVTSFPGDVGGALANVNRWRGQLNLPPIGMEELPACIEDLDGTHMPTMITRLNNGETSTIAATMTHAGHSWFLKMTGPMAAVERETEGFLNFLRSVDLHQHS